MAHFAQVENGVVKQVIVVDNKDCAGGDFPASEPVGQAFLASIGLGGTWLQTSYSESFRGRFAGIGLVYNPVTDEFVRPTEEQE
jgi:hypothetical protein